VLITAATTCDVECRLCPCNLRPVLLNGLPIVVPHSDLFLYLTLARQPLRWYVGTLLYALHTTVNQTVVHVHRNTHARPTNISTAGTTNNACDTRDYLGRARGLIPNSILAALTNPRFGMSGSGLHGTKDRIYPSTLPGNLCLRLLCQPPAREMDEHGTCDFGRVACRRTRLKIPNISISRTCTAFCPPAPIHAGTRTPRGNDSYKPCRQPCNQHSSPE